MIHLKVVAVDACRPPLLVLSFVDGEQRCFDVSPYLDKGIFKELSDAACFRSVQATAGFVAWPRGQDFCPDTLYLQSVPLFKGMCESHSILSLLTSPPVPMLSQPNKRKGWRIKSRLP